MVELVFCRRHRSGRHRRNLITSRNLSAQTIRFGRGSGIEESMPPLRNRHFSAEAADVNSNDSPAVADASGLAENHN